MPAPAPILLAASLLLAALPRAGSGEPHSPVRVDSSALAASADAPLRFPEAAREELERDCLDAVERCCVRLGIEVDTVFRGSSPNVIHLHPSFESKALATGSAAASSIDEHGDLHLALDDRLVSRADGRAEASFVLARSFGPAASPIWDAALSIALIGGKALEETRAIAAWIGGAGEATPFAGLTDPQAAATRSPLIQNALATVLAELVLESADRPAVEALWSRGELPATVDAIAYETRLAVWCANEGPTLTERRAQRAESRRRLPERGVSFAHEGYRIHDGYLSEQAGRSLARVRALGADAVSIMPFGSYRSTDSPEIRWLGRSRAGSETDESVMLSGARAKALGMTTLLKPHLWGHGWCGEVEMRSEEDWQRWFESYGEFLVHYALLGELGGFDWLSIGCELVRTTRDHAEEWRRLAQRARRLFAGGITYAANWGDEVERLGFADVLDAVGVDEYHSLSESETPTDDELEESARRMLADLEQLARRFGRPVLLTEFGYPARVMAWQEPHRPGRREEVSAADQARCYRAFTRAWRERDPERLVGGFVWKWPTFEEWSPERTDYWPAGAEVEEALEELWRSP